MVSSSAADHHELREPNSPLEGPKYCRRLNLPADASSERARFVVVPDVISEIHLLGPVVKDGEGDEAGEPEQHRQGVEREHGHRVCEGREESRCQGKVDED